jgi:hypothetical protein
MIHLKKFEGFGYSDDDFKNEVIRILKQYDIRPVQINTIINFYQDMMLQYEDEGKVPQTFVNDINVKLNLGEPGGNHLKIRIPRINTNSILNRYI